MNLLVIDNNIDPNDWGAKDLVHALQEVSQDTVTIRRAPESDLPASLKPFDRILISGSYTLVNDPHTQEGERKWITQLENLIQDSLDQNKPLLGLCFGAQLLAKVLGAQIQPSSSPEVGWIEIQKDHAHPLLENLPQKFVSYSYHYEEIHSLPDSAMLLAHSDRCAIQAFAVKEKNAFGLQFHPEKSLESARKTYTALSKKGKSKIFQHRKTDGVKVFRQTLFKNFLTL